MERKKKNILIFANGVLGDCIIFMPALREIQKMYPQSAGYQIYLVCLPSMKNLYIKYSECDDIKYITECSLHKVRYKGFIKEFYQLLHVLNQRKYEKVINAQTVRYNYWASLFVRTKERYAIAYERKFHRFTRVEQYLVRAKTDRIIFRDSEYFIGNIYRDLVRALGNEKYLSHVCTIRFREENSQRKTLEEPYVVIAPYGSDDARRIPEDILTGVISYFLDKTEVSVYLVGTADKNRQFAELFMGKKRVKDYIGATNIEQLADMIYHSLFVIAPDTGVTHFSTALGIRNICLVGSWGKGLFLPYNYDVKEGEECFPRCVYPSNRYECRDCDFTKGRGRTNISCLEHVRSGKSFLCLEQIDPRDVYREIDRLLESG